MTTSPYHISSLLDKMGSVDKDFRFMATNDLMTELHKDSIKLDDDSEKKVVQSVLRLVEDKNGEVQNLAVKCLGPLVKKIKDSQIEVVINALCANMFSDSERLRDISSVGLKTVIAELPRTTQTVANNASRNITGKLVDAITRPDLNQYVLLETLDILGDLIHRYGSILSPYHEPLLKALLPLLIDPKPLSVRKRAYVALCYLSACCQQQLFETIMNHLLTALNAEKASLTSITNTRTFIQAIGAISRQVGIRVGTYLEAIVTLIMHFIKSDGDDELKESCLQAFEALVVRCFREITPHIREIVDVSLHMLSHDPNYNYDTDEEETEDSMEMEEYDEEEDDEYSDDDDVSWKVRRAAAKCLAAILGSRQEMLLEFYRDVSPPLIARFKEREENVKADIFAAYRALLTRTKPTAAQLAASADNETMEVTDSPVALLHSQIPSLVKALHKQLKDKSIKTRQGCFSLLTALVSVLPGALDDHIGAIVPGILYSLSDQTSTSNMKIDSLNFLTVLLTHHSPQVLHPHIGTIIPAVVSAVDDSFYKITSEALLVLHLIVKTIRPLDVPWSFDFQPFVLDIYTSALKRLRAADIDQEVKERAIICMGQIISSMGDALIDKLPECMPIFVDRLRNEITRLTAVRAITQIARSPLKIDLTFILNDCIPLLASFLRKNHRDLRLATLNCLDSIFLAYTKAMTPPLYKAVMDELPVLISDIDLHISQLVLTLLCTVMEVSPQSVSQVRSHILPNTFSLVLSSLLQGTAMNACLQFFSKLVQLNLPNLGFQDIFQMLTNYVYNPRPDPHHFGATASIHRQAYRSISKCVSAICTAVPDQMFPTVSKFIGDIKSENSTDSVKLLCLLSVGEVGRKNDLSSIADLHKVILETFSSQSEEVRSAASYALGSVSAGNLKYLQFILSEIQANPKRQYLLLHSLKEVITCHYVSPEATEALKPQVSDIWGVLFQHFESPEEGTRNVVAECVGKLTLVDPETLLPELLKYLKSPSAYVRSTVVTALKYTISDQPQPIDVLLHNCIGEFLGTIGDPDLNVRRVALVAFNSAAHNKPSLIRDLLDSLLTNLYQETKVRKELIREVEMGPFKHTVDDGLDLRKAAFECMYTLLETCLDRVDIFEFLNHVEDGLKDHYDIKMLTFLLLVRLSHLRPNALLQRIDKLIEPLRSTVQSKAKANSVKQEFEKQDELKRSAMRAIAALLTIPDSDKSPQLTDFVAQIKSSTDTAQLFESIQADATIIITTASVGVETMDLT